MSKGERRRRKVVTDRARKTTEKYRRLRMLKRLRLPILKPDTNYGTHPSEPDIDETHHESELRQLCNEYLERLNVTTEEAQLISEKTSDQADHIWESQRRGRITSSNFGEVCKRKKKFSKLT